MKITGSAVRVSTNESAWTCSGIGPSSMTGDERKRFFEFYKKNPSRSLDGFFKDLQRIDGNYELLSNFLARRTHVDCLIMGCSYWANPNALMAFLRGYNARVSLRVVAIDVLPDALQEAVRNHSPFIPLLSSAQDTPFLDAYFDIVVADGLLNCCGFAQHEPIIREMHRITKNGGLVLLGLAYAPQRIILKPAERAMEVHCRQLKDFRALFQSAGFAFVRKSSYQTLLSEGSPVRIDNCIARKRPDRAR